MANPTLVVRKLFRLPSGGPEDSPEFTTGVNLLVGPPNAGKRSGSSCSTTCWVTMATPVRNSKSYTKSTNRSHRSAPSLVRKSPSNGGDGKRG